ncbi:MAG: hypothetical protein RL885_16465 [Planctomycetota bacterium]
MNANTITRRALSLLVLGLGLTSMVACSGGGGGSSFAPPAATVDVNGSWDLAMQLDATDCGGSVEENNEAVDMIQDGNQVRLIIGSGDERQGTISANVITVSHEETETDPDTGLTAILREEYRFEVAADSQTLTGSGTQSIEIVGLFSCTAPATFSGQRIQQ